MRRRFYKRVGARELAHRCRPRRGTSARACDRQPALVSAHGPRHRQHAERFWIPRRRAPAIRSCSITWPANSSPTAGILKPIHKMIMSSAAYLQESTFDKAKADADPENKVCSGGGATCGSKPNRSATRCSSVSGQLDMRMYGPGTLSETDHQAQRLSHCKAQQNDSYAYALFDATSATQSVGQRPSTTVAPQALELLNSPFVRECAKGVRKTSLHRRPTRHLQNPFRSPICLR